eukprot:6700104-Pyramimonas_sp.AAC.1
MEHASAPLPGPAQAQEEGHPHAACAQLHVGAGHAGGARLWDGARPRPAPWPHVCGHLHPHP